MAKAETSDDFRIMLLAARELRPWLELIGKLDSSSGPTRSAAQHPHGLAKEAKRYLQWYGEQFSGMSVRPGGDHPDSSADHRADDLIEIDDPDEGPPSRHSLESVELTSANDVMYELDVPDDVLAELQAQRDELREG